MKDNILSVRLEKSEYDFLNRWAQNVGLTVSDVVRQLLRQSMYSNSTNAIHYESYPQTSVTSSNSTVTFSFNEK